MRRSTFFSALGAAVAGAYLRDVALADIGAGTVTLIPMIETLLPFGTAGFPTISSGAVAERIESLFHLAHSPTFASSFASFSSIDDFPVGSTTLFAIEQATVPDADVVRAIAADALTFRNASLPRGASFESLSAKQRAEYVRLWSRSAFNARRRFYQSIRFVTYAALYSTPDVWPAIHYAGPVLQQGAQ